MSSLVTNLNSSTAQKIVNWVTTTDGCVHTADATRVGIGGVYWALRSLSVCLYEQSYSAQFEFGGTFLYLVNTSDVKVKSSCQSATTSEILKRVWSQV